MSGCQSDWRIVDVHSVIASGAKQSMLRLAKGGLLRSARNDESQGFKNFGDGFKGRHCMRGCQSDCNRLADRR